MWYKRETKTVQLLRCVEIVVIKLDETEEDKRETQEHFLFDFSNTQNIFQKLWHMFYFNTQPLFYLKWENNIYLSFKSVL